MRISLRVLVCTLLAIATSSSWADLTGDIVSIDQTAGTIGVSVAGGAPQVFRVKPSVGVTLNSATSKFADLSEGMSVKVTSGEPGVATRIDAKGMKEAGMAGGDLEKKLIGTTWLWSESKDAIEEITFEADGKAKSSARPRPYTWKVPGAGNRVEGAAPSGKKFRITFDATLTKGRLYEGDSRPRDTKRVTK